MHHILSQHYRPISVAGHAPQLRRCLRVVAAIALAGMASLPLHAQTSGPGNYPERPVRLIVSYAAGNVTDSLARIVSDKLSAQWGQAVTVENRPGQGGSIGAQTAVKAPADGYTLLFSAMAAMAINPHVYSNLGYDVRKDFAPIINVAYPSSLIVATPALKINTFKGLVDYSKAHPTALNYGTAGNGTVPHLNMEAIKELTGLIAQHVPYKAASAVMTDVMGGRLQLQGESVAVVMPQIKAGNLVPIAATSLKRLPQLPDLPTVSELVPGYVPVVPWLGIFAPVGTPPAIIAKVNQDVTAILNMPDVQQRFATVGLTTSGDGPQEFARTINNDYERLGKLVKQLGLKVD
ncbi:MAG: tripartite tricarboxylate transporter substrate binding protein [Rhodoferax sp.]|jgi:tripartite-type tricarboxylate transporter receptor subunit TctC|nr:tripartite tricarboxylate transporter substrate binding protein [Rhodoferax sp.]